MAKVHPISGFPEWLPQHKLVEEDLVATIKSIYVSHGFVPIETPAVEWLDSLASKGVVDREIYVVRRLHADEKEEADMGLHFDLTVPFARYVGQHFNDLVFPFKRYQLQKVWRGERPQRGRFREFYQFDVDIIARDELPLACDAEIVTILDKAFRAMAIGPHTVSINNRKLLLGLLASFDLDPTQSKRAVVAIDKLHKIGADGVVQELSAGEGVREETARRIVESVAVRCSPELAAGKLAALGVANELFEEGMQEVLRVCELLPAQSKDRIMIDLSLARGLDYYTGSLFEIQLADYPEFGSVGGGGRYNDLASQFINKKLPGVGASIGLTRLMDLIVTKGLKSAGRNSLAVALISVRDESDRAACNDLGDRLRALGVPTEVFYRAPKLGKQIEYADSRGIRYVLFLDVSTRAVEVKDLATKTQVVIDDIDGWCVQVAGRAGGAAPAG